MSSSSLRARNSAPGGEARQRRPRMSLPRPTRKSAQQNLVAYTFLAPWLVGIFGLTLGPMLASLYLSFTEFDLFTSPEWVGIENYRWMLFEDCLLYTSPSPRD